MAVKGYTWDGPSMKRADRVIRRVLAIPEDGEVASPYRRSGRTEILLAKTLEAISQGSSGQCQLHARGTDTAQKGDELPLGNGEDDDFVVEAYSRLAGIGSGKWCYIAIVEDYWEIINGDCS